MYPQITPNETGKPARLAGIDVARGVALIAMAVYHFTWDLEFFGYVEPGMTAVGGWKLFARTIASSFLFLAGVSLFLAHRNGIAWTRFGRRLAMVGGAAALITIATYVAVPGDFIFFGILHQIALASVIGLAFLRLPAAFTLVTAAAVIALPNLWRSAAFDHAALWWVGLSTQNPHSNDYVPLFPWFGAVLAGIAAAKLAEARGLLDRPARHAPARALRPLAFAGRHSLAFYLIHQPVLIGLVWVAAQLMPPAVETPEVQFRKTCELGCAQSRDEPGFCPLYCACMLDGLERQNALDSVFSGTQSSALKDEVQAMVRACTADTDARMLEEGAGP